MNGDGQSTVLPNEFFVVRRPGLLPMSLIDRALF